MTIFQHETTQQVIEVSEIKPGVFNVLGTPMEMSILNTCGWRECDTDPGYRGIPPKPPEPTDDRRDASADSLTGSSADHNPTTDKQSIGVFTS
jgi:hypothetical protein